jgi:hypothetical protein
MTTKFNPVTALERHVARWINARAQDYPGAGAEGALKDLFYGGCQSGLVGHLIYHKDTLAFYRKHRKEIDELLYTSLDDIGENGPADLFGEKWDKTDPLARDTQNQNLLAWFGFEETARKLADRAELDC